MGARTHESTIGLTMSALDPSRTELEVRLEEEVLSLFDQYRDSLLRYVCAFGFTVVDAEDLIQDVFVALFKHLRRGGGRSNLPGWLFRVAHNQALKHRTRRRRAYTLIRAEARDVQMGADPNDDPEERLAGRQRRRKLVAVLNALPERDRQCLYLRDAGMRYREIARVLGISLGAVAKSIARGVARLQRADQG
jgi:RNA polymerase sigma-70 factor (ECF subfamily)